MAKRLTLIAALVLGSLTLVAGSGALAPAQARIFVGIGVAPWGYYPGYYPDPYYYGYPPPVFYAPPPVVYAPPMVYAPAPAPVAAAPAPPAQSTWYYCDNPRGYYPYVANCSVGWRQVAATPQQ